MLVSLVAVARAVENCAIPETHGHMMQGALMSAITRVNAKGATRVHGETDGRVRGYTVSPLFLESEPWLRGHTMLMAEGTPVWFRLTGTNAETSAVLVSMAERTREWRVGQARFRIERWCAYGDEHKWAGMVKAEELAEAARAGMGRQADRLKLDFVTPVAFDSGHFPWPEWVFGSFRQRVMEGAPELARYLGEDRSGTVRIGAYALSTRMMQFRETNTAGFVGDCEFLLDAALGEEEIFGFHLLAAFGFYGGLGKQTSWGMGQVRGRGLVARAASGSSAR